MIGATVWAAPITVQRCRMSAASPGLPGVPLLALLVHVDVTVLGVMLRVRHRDVRA